MGKGGVFEKVVEVWSDLYYHGWLGDRGYLSFPSSPLLPHQLSRFCKVGWLGKGDSLHNTDRIDGRCGFVHSILTQHSAKRMKRYSKVKMGLP